MLMTMVSELVSVKVDITFLIASAFWEPLAELEALVKLMEVVNVTKDFPTTKVFVLDVLLELSGAPKPTLAFMFADKTLPTIKPQESVPATLDTACTMEFAKPALTIIS